MTTTHISAAALMAQQAARETDGKFGAQEHARPIRGLADDDERLYAINEELGAIANGMGITKDTIGEPEFDELIDYTTHMVNYQLGDPSNAGAWPIGFPPRGAESTLTEEKTVEINDWVCKMARENGLTEEAVGEKMFDAWTDTVTQGVVAQMESAEVDEICSTEGCYESLLDGEGSGGHCGNCADAMSCSECGDITDIDRCDGDPPLCRDCCREEHGSH